MKNNIRFLQYLVVAAFAFLLLIAAIYPKLGLKETDYRASAQTKAVAKVKLTPDQSFSGAPGSIIEYNVYLKNEGNSMVDYALTASSNQGYSVEVWRDTNELGGGDTQLIPPQGANITLDAGEMATLIVRVTIPSSATDGTVDATIIQAESTSSDVSDSVTVTTTIKSNLPYPSDWIQLGSDPLEVKNEPHPGRVDVAALYYTNNGTHVFVRMALAEAPYPKSFAYVLYMDTTAGGLQIDGYYYDFFLSLDGILYEWNGTYWVDSGYATYWRVDGTSIVLWADFDNLTLDEQDIHFFAMTATKDMVPKDVVGPYTILRENISQMPLAMIPLVTLAVYLAFSRRRKKRDWR